MSSSGGLESVSRLANAKTLDSSSRLLWSVSTTASSRMSESALFDSWTDG